MDVILLSIFVKVTAFSVCANSYLFDGGSVISVYSMHYDAHGP